MSYSRTRLHTILFQWLDPIDFNKCLYISKVYLLTAAIDLNIPFSNIERSICGEDLKANICLISIKFYVQSGTYNLYT